MGNWMVPFNLYIIQLESAFKSVCLRDMLSLSMHTVLLRKNSSFRWFCPPRLLSRFCPSTHWGLLSPRPLPWASQPWASCWSTVLWGQLSLLSSAERELSSRLGTTRCTVKARCGWSGWWYISCCTVAPRAPRYHQSCQSAATSEIVKCSWSWVYSCKGRAIASTVYHNPLTLFLTGPSFYCLHHSVILVHVSPVRHVWRVESSSGARTITAITMQRPTVSVDRVLHKQSACACLSEGVFVL